MIFHIITTAIGSYRFCKQRIMNPPNSNRRGSERYYRRNPIPIKLIFTLIFLSSIAIIAHIYVGIHFDTNPPSLSSITTQQYSDLAQITLDHNLNDPIRNRTPNLPSGCTYTVLIIRHCEFDPLSGTCNYLGQQRALYLATLFGQANSSRWPIPSHLYALDESCDSKTWGFFHRCHGRLTTRRDRYTLLPIASSNQTIVSLDHPFKLAHEIFHHILSLKNTFCGQVVVVAVSNVEDIPRLAFELGCGPYNAGCPRFYAPNPTSVYDTIWELTFVFTGASGHTKTSLINDMDIASTPTWSVFGNVIQQYFDPLSFSSQVLGLYDP